jgi:hypothetical protein
MSMAETETRSCLCCGQPVPRRSEPLTEAQCAQALGLICAFRDITPGELASPKYRDDLELMAPGFAPWLDHLLEASPTIADHRF